MKITQEELKNEILGRGISILDTWIGDERVKKKILAILVAGKNLLLEGPPGSGKTLIAQTLALSLPPIKVVDCDFNCLPEHLICPQCTSPKGEHHSDITKIITMPGEKRIVRIQGSPELTAEDLVGDIDPVLAFKYGPFDTRTFKPGKIIRANKKILFIDEINRVPERLQNTLLQMLQEGIMTIGGLEIDFSIDTVLIATMNPEEHAGVYRLSEALKDRLEKVRIGYPTPKEELKILELYGKQIGAVVSDDLEKKMVGIAKIIRDDKNMEQAVSVRATLSMFELVQSFALLRGDKLATKEDLREAALIAFEGRVTLSPDSSHYDHPTQYLRKLVDNELEAH